MQDDTGYPGEGWPKSEAARWYAAQGWRVVPLHTPYRGATDWHCSCQFGAACRDMGKHPRTMNGVKAATADAEVVAGWWEVWPDANIGIATGRPFAFVVDEDVPGALAAAWGTAMAERDPAGRLGMQSTPNGTHYLFDASDDFGSSTGGRGRSLGPGIDTRGDGGYIVVAPSETPSGRYVWRSSPIGPWPVLPEPMREALRPKAVSRLGESYNYPGVVSVDEGRLDRWVRSAVAASAGELASSREGTRNHTLNEVAFRLGTIGAHGVLGREYALGELYKSWHELGKDDHELMKTFESGWNAGLRAPREPWPPFEPDANVGFTWTGGLVQLGVPRSATAAWPALDWPEFLARDMTKADWLPGELFERGQQVALVGAGKAGKSLLAFELAHAIATGRPYLGAVSRPPADVAYVDFENGARDIQQRALAFGFSADELARLHYFSFPALPPLDTRAGGAALMQLVQSVGDGGAGAVILDTVSRMIEGNENDSDTWLALYRHSLLPLKANGIASVRLDHFGKDTERGARGSSAKTQDVDHVFELSKHDGGSLTLKRTHSRTGLGRDVWHLVRHGEQTEDGWLPGRTRHVVSDVAFRPAAWLARAEFMRMLDGDDGLPRSSGRRAIAGWLRERGHRISDAEASEIAKARQTGTDE